MENSYYERALAYSRAQAQALGSAQLYPYPSPQDQRQPAPAMSACVESELAAINKRLGEIDAMLAGLAVKLAEATAALAAAQKPPPKVKSPLTMRAYRGMQCGFNDD